MVNIFLGSSRSSLGDQSLYTKLWQLRRYGKNSLHIQVANLSASVGYRIIGCTFWLFNFCRFGVLSVVWSSFAAYWRPRTQKFWQLFAMPLPTLQCKRGANEKSFAMKMLVLQLITMTDGFLSFSFISAPSPPGIKRIWLLFLTTVSPSNCLSSPTTMTTCLGQNWRWPSVNGWGRTSDTHSLCNLLTPILKNTTSPCSVLT